MSSAKIDFIVKAAIEDISEKDVDAVKNDIDEKMERKAWSMNNRLNMIAYEDQR